MVDYLTESQFTNHTGIKLPSQRPKWPKLASSSQSPQSTQSKPWPLAGSAQRLLVLVGSLLAGTVIAVGLYLHSHSPAAATVSDAHPCLTTACLEVGTLLGVSENGLAQPCGYFFSTCGQVESPTFRGRHKGKENIHKDERQSGAAGTETWGWKGKERSGRPRAALLQLIRGMLESRDGSAAGTSAVKKSQQFYHSCMDKETIERLGSEPVLNLIHKLGGWAVSAKWRKSDFNETLALVMKEYNTFPFFSLYVGGDPNDTDTNSRKYIQIDQPDLQIPVEWDSTKKLSKANVEDLRHFYSSNVKLLELLGVPSSSTAQHTGLFIQLYSELALFTSPLPYRLEQQLLYHRSTIRDLQAMAPTIDWMRSLQAAFHPLPVNEGDLVLVHNMPYISRMSQIISKWQLIEEISNSDSLHTFMLLSLLNTVMPALDSRFFDLHRNFSIAIGNSEEVLPRWTHCVLQTEKGFTTGVTTLVREAVRRTEAEQLMEDVFAALRSQLAGLTKPDESFIVANKVLSLTPKLSPFPGILSEKYLDQEFPTVQVSENDYFHNFLQMLSLQRLRRNQLFTQTVDSDILSVSPSIASNEIRLPLGMFAPPLFHPSYPRAVSYGALGTLMAKNILQLLLSEIQMESEPVQTVSECLWAQYGNLTERRDRDDALPLTAAQQQQVWLQYSALKIALKAYSQRLHRQHEDSSLSGLSYAHLFFTAFTKISCEFEPYQDLLPFEKSFLVMALCMNSDVCPQSVNCAQYENLQQNGPFCLS